VLDWTARGYLWIWWLSKVFKRSNVLQNNLLTPVVIIFFVFKTLKFSLRNLEMDQISLWLGMDSLNKSSFSWVNGASLVVNKWDAGKPSANKKEACVASM